MYVSASYSAGPSGLVASASPCFGNRVMVVLIKHSLERKHFFLWLVCFQESTESRERGRGVKQLLEPMLLWFHEILWVNKMDELSREL